MDDPKSDESDALTLLQEILDEMVAGNTDGHDCPFCGEAKLEVPLLNEGRIRVECPGCQKFFEGSFW